MKFHPIPTEQARALQNGGPDFYGQPAERTVSDGYGNPCRHCLRHIPAGRSMLIAAYRPFPTDQPYAEVGPIFLCGDHCIAPIPWPVLPDILTSAPDYLIKGYTADHRIKYGTGAIVASDQIIAACTRIFDDQSVDYIHVRSARNNCYQCRVSRGGSI